MHHGTVRRSQGGDHPSREADTSQGKSYRAPYTLRRADPTRRTALMALSLHRASMTGSLAHTGPDSPQPPCEQPLQIAPMPLAAHIYAPAHTREFCSRRRLEVLLSTLLIESSAATAAPCTPHTQPPYSSHRRSRRPHAAHPTLTDGTGQRHLVTPALRTPPQRLRRDTTRSRITLGSG